MKIGIASIAAAALFAQEASAVKCLYSLSVNGTALSAPQVVNDPLSTACGAASLTCTDSIPAIKSICDMMSLPAGTSAFIATATNTADCQAAQLLAPVLNMTCCLSDYCNYQNITGNLDAVTSSLSIGSVVPWTAGTGTGTATATGTGTATNGGAGATTTTTTTGTNTNGGTGTATTSTSTASPTSSNSAGEKTGSSLFLSLAMIAITLFA
jgi:hypothetical protein